jgi:hypothetical protein
MNDKVRKEPEPAVKLAKGLSERQTEGHVQLSTGYWARIMPVSASLIDGAQALIEDPEPPSVWIDEKGRSELNPSDPAYLRALERAEIKRAVAAADAMILFGVDIVDEKGEPIPIPDGDWIKRLQLLDKVGTIDIGAYDFDDPIDKEFLFKKFVAVAAPDFPIISLASGVREEDVERATATFRGN